MSGSVADAMRGELEGMPDDLASSALAATALAMAERIDSGRGSPSECGKVLIHAMEQLRALMPPKEKKDGIDQLSERRRARRSRSAAAADM